MKRILFVDDEPRILEGLRRMLRGQRGEWEMAFAESGEAACAQLADSPFDVIVTDMRMPGMDGVALLRHVRERYPQMIRIILSGHSEQEAAFRAVAVAHQFLSKPCEAETIRSVVTRACNLQKLLNDPALRQLVGSVSSLPSLPKTHERLNQLLVNPNASLQTIGRVIEQDMGMSAKILQIVNSSFFGLPQRISNIAAAINYLGLQTIRNLVLSVETFRAFEKEKPCPGFSVEALQSHALATAHLIQQMMTDRVALQDAFTAGLLHDVGKLILATRYADRYANALSCARQKAVPLSETERSLLGVSHAEVGAYLLGIWGLPYTVVEAVAFHHEPGKVDAQIFDALTAVHVANVLAYESHPDNAGATGSLPPILDEGLVQRLNLADKLPAWRTAAACRSSPSAS